MVDLREAMFRVVRLCAGLAIGGAGGYLADLAGVPAGWLSGSLVASAMVSFAGFRVSLPTALVQVVFILLGITIGASVTPETLGTMRQWPLAFVTLILSMAMVVAAVVIYLRRFENYDRQTAFFSAIPGALSMVLAMTSQSRADMRVVVVTQSVRLVVLIALLPALIKLLGFGPAGGAVAAVPPPVAPLMEYAVLIGSCCLAALIAALLKFPGGTILGAMLASAALHGSGYTSAHLPPVVTILAFVTMGVLIASRLEGMTLDEVKKLLRASLMALAIGTLLSTVSAVLAAPLAGISVGKMVLAFAPGAFEAMIILAFVLDLDPAFVGSMHLARVIVISLALPMVARLYLGPMTPDR